MEEFGVGEKKWCEKWCGKISKHGFCNDSKFSSSGSF